VGSILTNDPEDKDPYGPFSKGDNDDWDSLEGDQDQLELGYYDDYNEQKPTFAPAGGFVEMCSAAVGTIALILGDIFLMIRPGPAVATGYVAQTNSASARRSVHHDENIYDNSDDGLHSL
jgi:hypothetical protein